MAIIVIDESIQSSKGNCTKTVLLLLMILMIVILMTVMMAMIVITTTTSKDSIDNISSLFPCDDCGAHGLVSVLAYVTGKLPYR